MEERKLLIVDDQFGIRMLLSEVFEKDGYKTLEASNGVQALKIVEDESPDLVMLDMKIPGMDGLEILKNIKKIDEKVDVVMMTAYGELEMINEAKEHGAIDHFAKPFDIDTIRQNVADHFEKRIKT
ncbi:response regulator [Texcoconibacillus texcoconensis]|uniref:Two-component system response regulator (Stage 0 sporulation protein F) n=1 Tax=Texcoconibacillus texcoconensis TaxID=1095777 RepID=A0A840QS06_9BACI|nr:response regulator [Texcoconibacillus texcoconensis]MBB5174103.1 two-component system response regulator (stage 0 sporulation protein F) [Texcoconibacillus texcoconensis]